MSDAGDASRTEDIRIDPLGDGRYRVVTGDRQAVAFAAGPAHERWVFLDGRTYILDATGGTGTPKAVDEMLELAAPMPATVAAIHVEPGQLVESGDVLVTLEAMKMEMPIRAPRTAVVKAVHCRVRELVQPGVPLVELD